jgi:hypothetical protein
MEERLPEDCDMLVSSMNNAVGIMSETLNDVLSYQKIEEGKLELVPATFSPKDELKKVLSVFDISAKSDQLDLRIRIEDDVPRHLVSDCHRIRQVIEMSSFNSFTFLIHAYPIIPGLLICMCSNLLMCVHFAIYPLFIDRFCPTS